MQEIKQLVLNSNILKKISLLAIKQLVLNSNILKKTFNCEQ